MQAINIFFVFLQLIFSGYSEDREVNIDTFYSGGTDSLRYDIGKNIVNSISNPEKDYFVFFEVTLKNRDSIQVNELYRKSDAMSAKVGKAIEATYSKWNIMEPNKKIIAPIFLISDQENFVKNSKIYTYTQRNYPFTSEIVNRFLMAPFIINYYYYKKGTRSIFSQIADEMNINWEKNIVCGDELEI